MSTDLPGLIIGSAHDGLPMNVAARSPGKTPYGMPSSPILWVDWGGQRVACIARHGERHLIPPHLVNYRANLWFLQQHGVRRCIAINTVGTISRDFPPGELAVPDQLIDYTWGREHTFADGNQDEVAHVDFTEPFDPELRGQIAAAAVAAGCSVRSGVCGVTQGPRLESAAEVDRLERDGCTMVGMTAMPEAALARELDMRYAVCVVGVNYAAGRGPGDASIHAQFERYTSEGLKRLAAVLERLIPAICQEAAP